MSIIPTFYFTVIRFCISSNSFQLFNLIISVRKVGNFFRRGNYIDIKFRVIAAQAAIYVISA